MVISTIDHFLVTKYMVDICMYAGVSHDAHSLINHTGSVISCDWTHPPPLDKMADILADDIFGWIFLDENDRIPIQISLKFVSMSPIDNKPAYLQVMAWRRTGDKPLPETMLTQFTDAYMRH